MKGLSSPPETLGGRIQYAPTLPAGDVSYLYPQHLPRTPAFLLFIFPFSMYPCRGVSHTPHKRPDRGDLIYLWVGVFIPAGYIWGVFFCAPTLPAEKTPGTQLDLSTRTRHLSLLDLSRFGGGSILFLP